MVQNGLDSFKFSLDNYKKYINIDNKYEPEAATYLKATIMFLQHTLEILNKTILSEHNELLMFDFSKPDNILKIIKQKEKLGLQGSLHEFVSIVQDSGIKTINYDESVNRIEFLYDLKNSHIVQTMKEINVIRNSITHYAYVSGLKFYKIMLKIDNGYRIIEEFYMKHLDLGKESYQLWEYDFDFYMLKELSLDLLEITQYQIPELFEAFYDEELEDIQSIFISLENDNDFQDECSKKNIKIKIECPKYFLSSYFDISITRVDNGELIESMGTLLIPALDTVAFIEETSNSVRMLMRFKGKEEMPELIFNKTTLEINNLNDLKYCYKYKLNPKTYKTTLELDTLKRVLLSYIDCFENDR